MILTLEELEDYVKPMVLVTLEGKDGVQERANMLTSAMIELIAQDRKAHEDATA